MLRKQVEDSPGMGRGTVREMKGEMSEALNAETCVRKQGGVRNEVGGGCAVMKQKWREKKMA